jgi:hypothetical protein
MRNKLTIIVLLLLSNAPLFAQADSAASDSTKPLVHPSSPLGISDETGLALFIVIVLFLIFSIFLWRRRLDRAMEQSK